MTVLNLQTLAQIFTERVLNTSVEGVVLAALVWILFRVVGRQDSGTRFNTWFSVLLAIVALPFLSESGFVASHFRGLPLSLHGGITLPTFWAGYLFAAWVIVASVLLFRLGLGLLRLRQLRRTFSDVDLASLDPEIAPILQDFGGSRRVKLSVSSDLAVPAAVGFFRPTIVFPAKLLPQLSTEEIKLILLHEFAHLQRHDNWTNLVQKIVKALFFFHPAVWWIENHLALEREIACDDIVLAQTAGPRVYASSLISFAEKLHNARSLALAQNLLSRMSHMSLRVTQILDEQRPRRTRLWKPALALSTGMFALVFLIAAYAPRFVAFEDRPQQSQTHTVLATDSALRQVRSSAAIAGTKFTGTQTHADSQMGVDALHARVVPATFTPRTAGFAPRLKPSSPRRPLAIKASATQHEFAGRETIFILQTTQYDASGSAVWTLCIWRVGGGNLAVRQVESAFLASSI
jgi:beta-lactamase regulating signal transducer with metallopeptidase domain